MPIPIYGKFQSATGTAYADAEFVESSVTGLAGDNSNSIQLELLDKITDLANNTLNSGRSFLRFNDGFTIDRDNLPTYDDKNIIYTAKNDKPFDSSTRPDINLPNDVEIQASTEDYPITFEFTHLGGSASFTDRNVVRFFLDGTQIGSILRDQTAVITKLSASDDYTIQNSVYRPNQSLLPDGVFQLKTDTQIDNIANIASELSGITITAGDAFLVVTGGTWSGHTIVDNSVIVALVDNPSLTNSESNNDWLVFENERVDTRVAAFFGNITQDGVRFDANRNIMIDDANVRVYNSVANGVPITRQILTNVQGTDRSTVYSNVPLQFSDLVGGTLQMSISMTATSTSGFLLQPKQIDLIYGSTTFEFPITNLDAIGGSIVSTINIPNDDYSGILNTNATVRFIYDFNGAVYDGNYTITNVVNSSKGNLHDAVIELSSIEDDNVRNELNTRIDQIVGDVDDENRSLAAISDRISPYQNIPSSIPDINTRYLDSTGVDAFPSDIGTMSEVSTDNPRYTLGDTAMFVAVIGGGDNYALKNITTSSSIPLDSSRPDVDLGESIRFNNQTYFVYRVTGLTSGHVFETDVVTLHQVVEWQNDINILYDDINRIDAELSHAVLNLPEPVVDILEHDITVTEETTPTEVVTDYNKGLGNTGNQTVFKESNPNTPSSGTHNSKPINENSGNDRYRNKLIYFPIGTTYTNQAYVTAFDGSTGTDLITYVDGVFNAKVFVPAIPAGSATQTVYPAPANRVSGKGIWHNIPALTFVNGVPVPESDELFFTRNIPTTATTLTIQYRGHANGNVFGTNTTTLSVGGSTDTSTSVTINDGSESATIEIIYYASRRQIRVSVTERVSTGIPTINDVEVILSYSETRTVPSTPATVRDVPIEHVNSERAQVFAFKASATGDLIIVGDETEIDTGYAYTTLFGGSEAGFVIANTETSAFFDYQNFEPISTTVTDLENHSNLSQFGLFSINYSHNTVVNLDTQMTVKDDDNNTVNVGTELVLKSPNGTYYRLSVENDGTLTTTEVL